MSAHTDNMRSLLEYYDFVKQHETAMHLRNYIETQDKISELWTKLHLLEDERDKRWNLYQKAKQEKR